MWIDNKAQDQELRDRILPDKEYPKCRNTSCNMNVSTHLMCRQNKSVYEKCIIWS